MSSDVWKIDAVHRYLREETTLLRNIMLMMYLRGGQAPRTTEFLSIECYNGPSTSRGIYVHSGSIVYVTRHSKARRMTNQEFQVARYLPKEDSSILKNMHDLGEVQRKPAVGDNGGSTFVYRLPQNSQRNSPPTATTTPMQSSPIPRTPFTQHVIGSPNGFSHLLWRSDESAPVDNVGVEAHEITDDDGVVQDATRLGSPNEVSAGSEHTSAIMVGASFELSQEHENSSVRQEDSEKTDRKLLQLARTLKTRLEIARNEISTLESQREHNQSQYLMLDRQANEQSLQETELLASAQRLREEALKAEGQAAECRDNVDRLHKEATGKRESEKHFETNIAATQRKANGIDEEMQRTRDMLRI